MKLARLLAYICLRYTHFTITTCDHFRHVEASSNSSELEITPTVNARLGVKLIKKKLFMASEDEGAFSLLKLRLSAEPVAKQPNFLETILWLM